MIKKFYSILDHTAGVFLNPYTVTNDGEAIRLFTTFVNAEHDETNISKYPEQFSLWYLGEFDDVLGEYKNAENKQLITGVAVQDNVKKKLSLEEIVNMFEMELKSRGVIDIAEKRKEMN
jgi:hypothetical protein